MRRESVSEKLAHFIDKNCFLMLLLCISYLICFEYLISDTTLRSSYHSIFAGILIFTTFICIIFSISRGIKILREYHPKIFKPLILFFLLFFAFFSVYRASFVVYFNGGEASNIFLIVIQLLMNVFGMFFFSIAISLVSYYMLIHSYTKNDKIKMIILFILSLILFIESNIYIFHSEITAYTSKIEVLSIYFIAVSIYNYFYILSKENNKISSIRLNSFLTLDVIIGLSTYIVLFIYILCRDQSKLQNFLNDNVFRESYDILLHYTIMPILQIIFMLFVMKNHKKIVDERK